jgi:transcriptional regulator with XRE-family HTH domain
MSRNIVLPLNSAMIKARMKELGYTYKDIEQISGEKITEVSLKHFLNKGTKAAEETIDILANLLSISKNHLIDKDYYLSTNLSEDVNSIVANLYMKNREDINKNYSCIIKEFRTNSDLNKMLSQIHRLFVTISAEDIIFDKKYLNKAFNIIEKEFILENCISNLKLTKLTDDISKNLFNKIKSASGEYNPTQAILMFLYVFIIFEAIFMEEAVASATQLVPRRKTEKADQYLELSYRNEKMRDALIDCLLYKDSIFQNSMFITENGIDVIIAEGISLILAACEKCYLHVNSDFVDSEYINRAAFSAILTKLEKVFRELDIELPKDSTLTKCINMEITRFGRYYNSYKTIFNSLNPPRKPRDKYNDGILLGVAINSFLQK